MELKNGEVVNLEGGKTARVEKELGRGGQGIVYEVSVDGKRYALKWYTCKLSKPKKFRENLTENIKNGSPDIKFLWPLFLTEERQDSFGYIMDLRPKDFSEFPDILNNKVQFASMRTIVDAAINITNAFRSLHRKGLSYQDLNDGNFFVNVQTGDVLICDNDNVTPDGEENAGNIGGKPGYMAPEIFRGDSRPKMLTDRHSLAVILFKLFFRHDPLWGKLFESMPCMTEERELNFYGKNPIFIFDPNNTSNRPVPGVHPNPIKLWPRFPTYIHDAFIKSFSEGMKDPNRRLSENEWQKILIRLRYEILNCPACNSEQMLWQFEKGKNMAFSCKHSYSYPYMLVSGSHHVPLFPKTVLYKCHTTKDSDDYSTHTGEVIMNKNNPSLWGIKNLSDANWSFVTKSGEQKTVGSGSVVPIAVDLQISMGNGLVAKIEK